MDNARIAGALGVVVMHSGVWMTAGAAEGSPAWWVGILSNEALRWCVPVFVMVSGALLLDPTKFEPISTFYRKRTARLLAPWLFWSLFYLGWTWIQVHLVHGQPVTGRSLVYLFTLGIPYPHMWYLFMVLPLYLFAPFLRRWAAHLSSGEFLTLTVGCFVLSMASQIWLSANGVVPPIFDWFLLYIPYFLLGRVLDLKSWRIGSPLLFLLLVASVLFSMVGHQIGRTHHFLSNGLYFQEYLSLGTLGMSFAAILLLSRLDKPFLGRANRTIANLTLAIYLVHPVFLDLFREAIHPDSSVRTAVLVPVTASVAFGLSLGCGWIGSRIPLVRRVF